MNESSKEFRLSRYGRTLKKERSLANNYPIDMDAYSLTAMISDIGLFISHHDGKRATEDARELFEDWSRDLQ